MSQDGSDSTESCSRAGSIIVTRTLKPEHPAQVRRIDSPRGNGEDPGLLSTIGSIQVDNNSVWDMLGGIPALGFTVEAFSNALDSHLSLGDDPANEHDAVAKQKKPFHKWMNTIRRRAAHRHTTVAHSHEVSMQPPRFGRVASTIRRRGHRRHSSSGSSFGFVTSIKSASVSLATASIMARSRRTTLRSSQAHSRADRNSRASISGNRASEDSSYLERSSVIDKAVVERSLQRRRILEELIRTEESYIGDLRFLMNVYVTILISLPTLPFGLRSSINRNLADISELHEEILGELHRTVPYSEYTQLDITSSDKRATPGHHRWKSLDAVPEDREGVSWLEAVPGMIAEPQVAADVAKLFARKMGRFFIYEEYGAKYEMMMKDIASAHRTMPQWETYQKGLEALAASLDSGGSHNAQLKKSSTIGDLLVKPIQRVCKYPLLFAELLKYTPVCDCPHSHMEIEDTLVRLREATAEINRATDDVHVRAVLQKTWLLQDRLVFPDQKLDTASKSCIRGFGHIQLCGVLHVCWQTRDGVDGRYMVSLLYRDWLCLATGSKVEQVYTIQACIPLDNIRLEAPDNGRGLQCHTAPYTWKVVFECDCQLYEIVMTACTSREETEWRSRLVQVPAKDALERGEAKTFNFLSLNIKTLGTVFGKQGTVARRMSIHRATTVGPKSPLSHVILKNTTMEKDPTTNTPSSSINRSQSLLAASGRVPVLAPSPGDRARLEALVSDVWTREVLPFPGMTARARSEHAVRSSASSMIRKLSVTSIASTFTKRSPSVTSITRTGTDDGTEMAKEPQRPVSGKASASPGIVACHPNDSTHSRLSIIDDDSEKHSPSTTRIHSGENAAALPEGSGHRLVTISNPTGLQLDQLMANSPVLRPASANNLWLSPQLSEVSKKSSCPSDKENVQHTSRSRRNPSTRRVSNAKHKVEMLRRGAVAQGIRSLFR